LTFWLIEWLARQRLTRSKALKTLEMGVFRIPSPAFL
jgi:hypothetical protein